MHQEMVEPVKLQLLLAHPLYTQVAAAVGIIAFHLVVLVLQVQVAAVQAQKVRLTLEMVL